MVELFCILGAVAFFGLGAAWAKEDEPIRTYLDKLSDHGVQYSIHKKEDIHVVEVTHTPTNAQQTLHMTFSGHNLLLLLEEVWAEVEKYLEELFDGGYIK